MKIKFIFPQRQITAGQDLFDERVSASFVDRKYGSPPLVLPTLAALVPSDVEIVLTDENVEEIDFSDDIDLVGITFNTAWAKRAYEISSLYRKKGVPVLFGGMHASMLPEEAIQNADSVVMGEAENILEQVISDFRKNKLQKFYQNSSKPDLKDSPVPRWDLLKTNLYSFHSIQTSRGCPFDCDFCGVKVFYGEKYRFKPMENVIKEIKLLKQIDAKKPFFFVDDNIINNPNRAKNLFEAIIPLNIRWFGQASINVASNSNLLNLMYKSGCRQLFIGFESVSQKSLDSLNKGKVNKVSEYKDAIQKIYTHGISIFGSFMLGNDFDNKDIFEKTVAFINDCNIPYALVNIITPIPGTRFWERIEKEGRILSKDWERYDGNNVCFKSNLIPVDVLQEGLYWVIQKVYSYENIYKRLNNLWKKGILVSHRKNIFSKPRIYFTYKSMFLEKKDARQFALKSLWYPRINKPSLTSILLGLNFHEYAYSFPQAGNMLRYKNSCSKRSNERD